MQAGNFTKFRRGREAAGDGPALGVRVSIVQLDRNDVELGSLHSVYSHSIVAGGLVEIS